MKIQDQNSPFRYDAGTDDQLIRSERSSPDVLDEDYQTLNRIQERCRLKSEETKDQSREAIGSRSRGLYWNCTMLMLLALIGYGRTTTPINMVAVMTLTGVGKSNTEAAGPPQGTVQYFEYSSTPAISPIVHATVNGSSLFVFDNQGTKLASGAASQSLIVGLVLKDPMLIVHIKSDWGDVFGNTLQYSGGWALVSGPWSNSRLVSGWGVGGLNDPKTNYVYFSNGGFKSSSFLSKLDVLSSAASANPVQSSYAYLDYPDGTDYCMDHWNENWLLYLGSVVSTGYTILKSDMSFTVKWTQARPVDSWVFDNLRPSIVIFAGGTAGVSDHNMSQSGNTLATIHTAILTNMVLQDYFLTFGPYDYVGLFVPNGNFVLIAKPTLTLASSMVFTPLSVTNRWTYSSRNAGVDGTGTGFYVTTAYATSQTSTANFMSYKIVFDSGCYLYDSAGALCQTPSCSTGTYLDTTQTTPTCTSLASISAGAAKGLDIPNNVISRCRIVGCTDCVSNIHGCTACKYGCVLYTPQGGINCTAWTSLPAQTGCNLATLTYSSCSSAGCLNCSASYSACISCDTISYCFDSSVPACVAYSGMTLGQGCNTVSNLIQPCTVAGCSNCSKDISKCLTCQPNYCLIGNAECRLYTSFTVGTGCNSATNASAACSVAAGCTDCSANYAVCVACDPALYCYISATHQCVLNTMIANGEGCNRATNGTSPCTVSGCNNCAANYSTCIGCFNVYCYTSSDHQCTLTSSLTAGQGCDLVNKVITSCASPGCTNCKANSSACSACDTGYCYISANTSCLPYTSIASGQGCNSGTSAISTCQSAGCTNCQASYTTCTACNTAQYCLVSANHSCVAYTAMGTSQGCNNVLNSILPCAVVGCSSCAQDFQGCTACSAGYCFIASNQTCVLFSSMPAGQGCDTGTNVTRNCSFSGCVNCSDNFLTCHACSAGNCYISSNTSCLSYSSIAPGSGCQSSTNSVAACSMTGCLNCSQNYAQCFSCDAANYCYLSANQSCVLYSSIGSGVGCDAPSNALSACSSGGCTDCRRNRLLCVACNTTAYCFISASSSCVSYASLSTGQGCDATGNATRTCASFGCLDCSQDYRICTLCDASLGYFLNVTACALYSAVPAGFGVNELTHTVIPCASSTCTNCTYNYSICVFCNVLTSFLNQTTSACQPLSTAPIGTGVNTSSSLLANCSTPYCPLCQNDYRICTKCANNISVINNSCMIEFSVVLSPHLNPNADLSLILVPQPVLPAGLTISELLLLSKVFLTPDFTLVSNVTHSIVATPISKMISNTSGYLTLDITFPDAVAFVDSSYGLQVYTVKDSNLTFLTTNGSFAAKIINTTVGYTPSAYGPAITAAKAQGSILNAMLGSDAIQSPGATTAIMGAIALDPSGVLVKLSQLLKLISKLYYVNINYGKRLDAFLSKIKGFMTLAPSLRAEDQVYNSVKWEGKVSKDKIGLNFVEIMFDKILIYLVSWVIKLIHGFVMLKYEVNKKYLYVLYYAPKVHLIIFNLVFIDFTLFASRTLLQSRGYSIFTYLIVIVVFFCVLMDFIEMYTSSVEYIRWNQFKEVIEAASVEEKPKQEDKEASRIAITANQPSVSASTIEHSNLKPDSELPSPTSGKREASSSIDYQKTYMEIRTNYHLIELQTTGIRLDNTIISSFACRMLSFMQTFRLAYYQLAILNTQYSPKVGLLSLMFLEGGYLAFSSFCYSKFKHSSGKVLLFMEISQKLFMFIFMTLTFVFSWDGFDPVISDFYQDAGIWIVIASCVAEYLLLLTYIGVALYDFFKNRKNKKGKSKMDDWGFFIKYRSAAKLNPKVEVQKPTLALPSSKLTKTPTIVNPFRQYGIRTQKSPEAGKGEVLSKPAGSNPASELSSLQKNLELKKQTFVQKNRRFEPKDLSKRLKTNQSYFNKSKELPKTIVNSNENSEVNTVGVERSKRERLPSDEPKITSIFKITRFEKLAKSRLDE